MTYTGRYVPGLIVQRFIVAHQAQSVIGDFADSEGFFDDRGLLSHNGSRQPPPPPFDAAVRSFVS